MEPVTRLADPPQKRSDQFHRGEGRLYESIARGNILLRTNTKVDSVRRVFLVGIVVAKDHAQASQHYVQLHLEQRTVDLTGRAIEHVRCERLN
jgi:hypothetical protein